MRDKIVADEKFVFCDKCGAKMKESSQFCRSCGAQVILDEVTKEVKKETVEVPVPPIVEAVQPVPDPVKPVVETVPNIVPEVKPEPQTVTFCHKCGAIVWRSLKKLSTKRG